MYSPGINCCLLFNYANIRRIRVREHAQVRYARLFVRWSANVRFVEVTARVGKKTRWKRA